MTNKILAIIRVSTVQQELESQKVEVREFVKSKGFKDSDIIFVEAQGASARKLNAKYIQFIETITNYVVNKGIKNVAMWHLNRLGRVEKVLSDMKDLFIKNQVQVFVKEPSITLFKDNGEVDASASIAWSLFATMVALDTDELMKKTQRGREMNRKQGKFNGGAYGALYGYQVDENGYVVPNVEESEVVNNIFKMYASGKYSIRSLVVELNERGVSFRGRKVTDSNLFKLLKNTSYVGKNEDRVYQPIVDDTLWKAVEQVRTNQQLHDKSKESKHINLAVKILKCYGCGHNYIATKNKYVCYKHALKHRFQNDCEDSVAISVDVMDKILWDIAFMKHLDFMQDYNEEEVKKLQSDIEVLKQKIATAQKKIDSTNERHERNAEMYVNGDISKEKFNQLKAKVEQDKKELEISIKNNKNEIKSINKKIEYMQHFDVDNFVNMALDLDSTSSKEKMKELVQQYIKVAYVKRAMYKGRKAINVQVNCYDGSVWDYMYLYTIKDKKKQLMLEMNGEYDYVAPQENELVGRINGERLEHLVKLVEHVEQEKRIDKLLSIIES